MVSALLGWNRLHISHDHGGSCSFLAIRRGLSGIRDRRLLLECWTFVYDGSAMHAREGYTDDLVMAWAISEDARTGGAPTPADLPVMAA